MRLGLQIDSNSGPRPCGSAMRSRAGLPAGGIAPSSHFPFVRSNALASRARARSEVATSTSQYSVGLS